MNARRLAPIALAALLAVGTTGGVALANNHNDEGNDAAALANAKVTLVQAIATGVDNENGRVTIAVEVAAKGGVHTVLIDPATGLVAATRAGGDHEGNDEEND
jgi:hypothetical protein